MTKQIEMAGVILAVIGSFTVASGNFSIGYPIFVASSIFLCYTAMMQKNRNLLVLNAFFLVANILGILKNNLQLF